MRIVFELLEPPIPTTFFDWVAYDDQRGAEAGCGLGSTPHYALAMFLERVGLDHLPHGPQCGWHCDQYEFECDCGLIAEPHLLRPAWMEASDE